MVDLTGAYAITLLNPWGHLVAHHGKTIENRSWMPYEGVNRLLIHSGKGWDKNAPEWTHRRDLGQPATSAIVAVADLAHACNASRWTPTKVCACGEWAADRQCHWQLANVRTLRTPVPATGRQGLWRPTRELIHTIKRELAHA